MTKDDIIELARESGIEDAHFVTPHPGVINQLERFANRVYVLAAEREREECAKLCAIEADNPSCLWEEPGCWQHAAENCAGSIRARGTHD